jgi:phenylpropionate dioxygenase-like ring-hydroxylating dioxygenase large terminal subunit
MARGAPRRTPIPCTSQGPCEWFRRDMEMSWEVLAENVNDPSHVPFSHHGVQGARAPLSLCTTLWAGVTHSAFVTLGYKCCCQWSSN